MLIAAGGVMAGSITVLLELPFVMASMVVASVATMGLLAAGVSVPALFSLTGSATLLVAVLFWCVLPGFASLSELGETAC
jgi:hypothetical protein